MAESKRVSGRQVSSTSGRAPAATSTSGRTGAPSGVSASGRMTAASSGRAPTPQSSGSRARMAAAAPAAPARASARSRARGDEDGARPRAKKQRVGAGPLLIAGGAILLLGIAAAAVYMSKNSKITAVENEKRKREEIFENNMKKGAEAFRKAESAGLLYCMGKEKDDVLSDEQKLNARLFGAMQGDSNIYNVLFERRYKDKKAKEKTEQKFMFPERNRIERMEVGKTEGDLRITYGFAENKAVPLVVASKLIQPDKGDQANLGGTITVIVRAEEDEKFRVARQPKDLEKK